MVKARDINFRKFGRAVSIGDLSLTKARKEDDGRYFVIGKDTKVDSKTKFPNWMRGVPVAGALSIGGVFSRTARSFTDALKARK